MCRIGFFLFNSNTNGALLPQAESIEICTKQKWLLFVRSNWIVVNHKAVGIDGFFNRKRSLTEKNLVFLAVSCLLCYFTNKVDVV